MALQREARKPVAIAASDYVLYALLDDGSIWFASPAAQSIPWKEIKPSREWEGGAEWISNVELPKSS